MESMQMTMQQPAATTWVTPNAHIKNRITANTVGKKGGKSDSHTYLKRSSLTKSKTGTLVTAPQGSAAIQQVIPGIIGSDCTEQHHAATAAVFESGEKPAAYGKQKHKINLERASKQNG
jgi:hypothetical protein